MERTGWRTPLVVLACCAMLLAIAVGIRHGFGLFLQPMSADLGWGREVFAFSMAVQNLVWGVAQPFTGMFADRLGAGKAIFGGGLLYALGLAVMAHAGDPATLTLGAGLFIGLGLSGTSFSVVFGAVSRAMPPEKRSAAMGITAAVGSFGQFAMLPGTMVMISSFGWSVALLALAGVACLMLPLAVPLSEKRGTAGAVPNISIRAALAEAFAHRDFWLLCFGFFTCGFQVIFIGLHLPAYLVDQGLPVSTGTTVLALVGLFNIAGTYLAGVAGGRLPKPIVLSAIYAARGLAITAFILMPLTEWSAYAFGIAMGLLWLSTVPLTNGIVASVYGVQNMSMLGGIVFFFHQVGSFLGGWLGGYIYDRAGTYEPVWIMAIALSVAATLFNLPIRETPVARLRTAGQAAE